MAKQSTVAAALNAKEYEGWKECWVKPATNNPGAIMVINSGSCGSGDSVVSEGIGYGMLLSVANSDRTTFDGLWKTYQSYLDSQGLRNWSIHLFDKPENNNANAATDGDVDVAMGLLQADKRWGGYKSAALALIQKIRVNETENCGGTLVLRPGDKFGGCSDQNNKNKLNPSYFAPGLPRRLRAGRNRPISGQMRCLRQRLDEVCDPGQRLLPGVASSGLRAACRG